MERAERLALARWCAYQVEQILDNIRMDGGEEPGSEVWECWEQAYRLSRRIQKLPRHPTAIPVEEGETA